MRFTTRTLALCTTLVGIIVAAPAAHAIDLNPLSYVKGAVEAVVEDRSANDIAKDAEIKAKIYAAITDSLGTDMIAFNADVYEQDVMITGIVEDDKLRAEAGRMAGRVEGVKNLYNDVLIIPKVQQKGLVEGFVEDSVIDTKINAQLLDAKAVNVTNFRWRSIGGHVFMFGRAFTQDELDKAISVVKGIENVTNVTSRVKIKAKAK